MRSSSQCCMDLFRAPCCARAVSGNSAMPRACRVVASPVQLIWGHVHGRDPPLCSCAAIAMRDCQTARGMLGVETQKRLQNSQGLQPKQAAKAGAAYAYSFACGVCGPLPSDPLVVETLHLKTCLGLPFGFQPRVPPIVLPTRSTQLGFAPCATVAGAGAVRLQAIRCRGPLPTIHAAAFAA